MASLRIDRFAKGVIFAALAALMAVVGVIALAPLFGAGPSVAACFGGLALLWLHGIARRPADGFKALLVATPLVGGALLVWPDPTVIAVGSTALVGVARGVFLRPGPAARTALVEGAVGLGSLGLASTFVPGGLTGLGLAVWSWCLVQSLPLLAARQAKPAPVGRDGFDAAVDRAERLLAR